jgi:predicted metal-binding protein
MHEQQLDMYDIVTPVHPMWECRETCRRFGEKLDYPSWWFGEARCLLPEGNNMKHVNFDNRCYIWCDLYERRDDDAGNG